MQVCEAAADVLVRANTVNSCTFNRVSYIIRFYQEVSPAPNITPGALSMLLIALEDIMADF